MYNRTEGDLQQAAVIQFDALKISSDHFDLGQIGEAARIANALFVLAGEDMRAHTSILDAANQKDQRLYRSTRAAENYFGCSLIYAELEKVAEDTWEIRLRHAGRTALEDGRDLSFSEWWNEPVVVNDTVTLTRADVVRVLRDKAGGAHFDPIVNDPKLARALQGEIGLFNITHADGRREVVPFGLEYCMRQIVTEFWFSLGVDKRFNIAYANECAKH